MSKWNPIVSGRALAAPGDLTRRRCLDIGARPCHRVTANGFSPRAYRGRDIIVERRADVAPMSARLRLATTAAASVRPKTASPKFLCRSADRPLFFHCDGAKNSAVERYTNRSS